MAFAATPQKPDADFLTAAAAHYHDSDEYDDPVAVVTEKIVKASHKSSPPFIAIIWDEGKNCYSRVPRS